MEHRDLGKKAGGSIADGTHMLDLRLVWSEGAQREPRQGTRAEGTYLSRHAGVAHSDVGWSMEGPKALGMDRRNSLVGDEDGVEQRNSGISWEWGLEQGGWQGKLTCQTKSWGGAKGLGKRAWESLEQRYEQREFTCRT